MIPIARKWNALFEKKDRDSAGGEAGEGKKESETFCRGQAEGGSTFKYNSASRCAHAPGRRAKNGAGRTKLSDPIVRMNYSAG